MIHVRMSAGDGLQLKSVLVDCLNNFLRRIAGIDADRASRLLATDDPSVLFEGGHCDFFDDHAHKSAGTKNKWSRIQRSIIPHRSFHHERF